MMDLSTCNGTPVSRLGLGCSNFGKRCDAATSREIVIAALESGVNFFDVADVYGGGTAETLLADGLRGHRDAVVIATKFGHRTDREQDPRYRGGHPRNVFRSVERSLKALQTDYIDLYQLHEPDHDIPIEDTMGALHALVEQGKIRWAGCSNFTVQDLAAAHEAASRTGIVGFRTVQNEYSMLVREAERDVIPHCRRYGLGFIPYFPLASGVLTGKYRVDQRIPSGTRVSNMKPDKLFRFFTPRALALVESLIAFGQPRGRGVTELALGFLLAEPTVVSVIAGAMSPEQVRSNTEAARVGASLDIEEISALRAICGGVGSNRQDEVSSLGVVSQ